MPAAEPAATAPSDRAATADELARLIAQSRRLVWSACQRALEAEDESMLAWQVLARLTRQGPMSQADLAHATAQHAAGMSRLLVDLERRRLVSRRRDPADRRRVLVAATPRGREHFQRHHGVVRGACAEVLAALSPRQQDQLREILLTLVGGSLPR